jgi:hypothetical protein
VFVEGAAMRLEPLSRDFHGPRAILNAVERLIGSYDAQCATARKNLAIAQDQLRDYQARLGASFPHDTYLMELTGLRDQLKAALSITTPIPRRSRFPQPMSSPSGSRPSKPPIPLKPHRSGSRRTAPPGPKSRSRHVAATGSRNLLLSTRKRMLLFPQQYSPHPARLRPHRRSLGFSRSGVRMHPPSPEPSTRNMFRRTSARLNAR